MTLPTHPSSTPARWLAGACLAVLLPSQVLAEMAVQPTSWRLLRTKEGVRIYQESGSEKPLPRFRAIGSVSADLPVVRQVLTDVAAQTAWVPNCQQSKRLGAAAADGDGGQAMRVYQRYDIPWPLRDRDIVMSVRHQSSSDNQRTTIEVHELTGGVPQQSQVVRIPRLRGTYRLRQVAPGKTEVAYEVDMDLGGHLPGWFLRWVGKDVPYVTMEKLRQRVRQLSAPAG